MKTFFGGGGGDLDRVYVTTNVKDKRLSFAVEALHSIRSRYVH